MSPFFVKHFIVKNPCSMCPKTAPRSGAPGSALCAPHKTAAKLAWRVWAVTRREEGKCNTCQRAGQLDRKTGQRNCRCAKHRKLNRAKCAAWSAENPGRSAQAWKKRVEILDSGLCICSLRTVLKADERRCVDCRAYQKAVVAGDEATLRDIRARRYEARKLAANNRAQEAARQLGGVS